MTISKIEKMWAREPTEILALLKSDPRGLSTAESDKRRLQAGANTLGEEDKVKILKLVARQFGSPLVLILLFGATLSFALGQWTG
jgi:P-type Mg2+ transporter